jgi:diguanylate cyclase (GGDEF)-like protein
MRETHRQRARSTVPTRARRLLRLASLPAALGALCVLLLEGAFALPGGARAAQLVAWAFLLQVSAVAGVRRLWRDPRLGPAPARFAAEEGALWSIAALALLDATGGAHSPLAPVLYLLGASFVLAHPLPLALLLLAFALGLTGALFASWGALPERWPHFAAHVGFTALFAALYHALLAARLRAARVAEERAVKARLEEAERRAREYRLVATAEAPTDPPDLPGRAALASVAELEGSIRGALHIAEAALGAHTAALFWADDESLRLRECVSRSDGLYRGPLPLREGALGAVLAAGAPVRLEGDAAALTYYEGRAPVASFLGAPVCSALSPQPLGVLAADRAGPFTPEEERLLLELAAQIARSIEAEHVLSAVRGERDEKARFFRALEELNRTHSVPQAAQVAVAQARALCPGLDLCALTLAEDAEGEGEHRPRARARHRVEAVSGEGEAVLRGLSFADNAGLVSNVVRLGAPLPARAPGEMERVVLFDAGTVVRGLRALKIFPLRSGEDTLGALVCAGRRRDALPEAAQRELSLLAEQAAGALVRARLHDRAQRLATTDGLTGLMNRRSLDAQLQARLREAQRYRRKLSLVLIDVDHFKRVNDTYGHPAGDAVLEGVAAVLRDQARATDLAARYGGEEMALVLPETDEGGARAIAERVRAAVAQAQHATDQGSIRVTVSLGVATTPDDGETAEGLIEAADRALYRAKQAGRDRVESARGRAAA